MRLDFRALAFAAVAGLTAPAICQPAAVSFRDDIAPIFLQKCIACHDEKKAKGGLELQSFAALLKGGRSKEPLFIPGAPDRSKLYQLLVAADEDDRMPQKDDPLPREEIGLIREWIAQGGHFDGPDTNANIATFLTIAVNADPPVAYRFAVPITALAFRPDATQIASSGYHEILVWDAQTGELLRRIKGMPQKIQRLAFSPDGKWLAAATGVPGKLGQINLIDMESEKPAQVLASAPETFLAVSFNADASALVAGGADNTIRIIDFKTRHETRKVEQHADWVLDVAFHPDGKHVLSASRDKTVRVVNRENGELESTYQGHAEAVFSVAMNAKGDRVFSAGRDRKIQIWEPKEAKKIAEITGFDGDIYQIIVAKGRVFAACGDGTISEYHLEDKRDLVRTYKGHRDAVFALALSGDGTRLASGSFDGEIRIWQTESGDLVRAFIGAPGKTSESAALLHNAH